MSAQDPEWATYVRMYLHKYTQVTNLFQFLCYFNLLSAPISCHNYGYYLYCYAHIFRNFAVQLDNRTPILKFSIYKLTTSRKKIQMKLRERARRRPLVIERIESNFMKMTEVDLCTACCGCLCGECKATVEAAKSEV